MKNGMRMTFLLVLAAVVVFSAVSPLVSKEEPADNTQILLDKIKADKKLLVAENMELTESEAKGFWPVYEDYQKELTALNDRLGKLIVSYAEDYNAGTITDEKAEKLIDGMLAISKAETELQASFAPKLGKVLSPVKVLRYLQIENKIRALINFALADEVPLIFSMPAEAEAQIKDDAPATDSD